MVRKLFLTPPALPEETQCRGLVIPSSKEWLGIFSQALLLTTYAHNYEQVNPTDLTAEETAAQAWQLYIAWLDATCAGGCRQPGGGRVYRRSPTTGNYEYLEDEEWVEDEDIPPVPARSEPTEYERRCAAATNAVNVLRLTWIQGKEDWDANVSSTDAYVDQSIGIAALIGAVFYPPILSILALTQAGWDIVYAAYEALSFTDWDDAFNNLLVCLFLEHATVVDGAVHFDLPAIQRELFIKTFTLQVWLVMYAQLEFIIGSIGAQALDFAGSLTAVEGECDDCGEWCVEWLTGNLLEAFSLVYGVVDGDGNIAWQTTPPFDGGTRQVLLRLNDFDTSDCVITELAVRVWKPAGGSDAYVYLAALPGLGSDSPGSYQYFNWSANLWFVSPVGQETTSDESDLSVRVMSNSTQAWSVTGIRARGRGRMPFSSGATC